MRPCGQRVDPRLHQRTISSSPSPPAPVWRGDLPDAIKGLLEDIATNPKCVGSRRMCVAELPDLDSWVSHTQSHEARPTVSPEATFHGRHERSLFLPRLRADGRAAGILSGAQEGHRGALAGFPATASRVDRTVGRGKPELPCVGTGGLSAGSAFDGADPTGEGPLFC